MRNYRGILHFVQNDREGILHFVQNDSKMILQPDLVCFCAGL